MVLKKSWFKSKYWVWLSVVAAGRSLVWLVLLRAFRVGLSKDKLSLFSGPLFYAQSEETDKRFRERLYRNGSLVGVEPSYDRKENDNYSKGGLRAQVDYNVRDNVSLTAGGEFVRGQRPKLMVGGKILRWKS